MVHGGLKVSRGRLKARVGAKVDVKEEAVGLNAFVKARKINVFAKARKINGVQNTHADKLNKPPNII